MTVLPKTSKPKELDSMQLDQPTLKRNVEALMLMRDTYPKDSEIYKHFDAVIHRYAMQLVEQKLTT